MMLVEPKSVIKRLTRTCTAALESAVVQCVNARHYEVTVEHVLFALLDNPDSDVAFLAMHYDLQPAQLRTTLQRTLEDLRTGNAGKPTFSPTMLEWMQDAWVIGSMEFGFGKIRSGVLFARMVQQPTKYTMSGHRRSARGHPQGGAQDQAARDHQRLEGRRRVRGRGGRRRAGRQAARWRRQRQRRQRARQVLHGLHRAGAGRRDRPDLRP